MRNKLIICIDGKRVELFESDGNPLTLNKNAFIMAINDKPNAYLFYGEEEELNKTLSIDTRKRIKKQKPLVPGWELTTNEKGVEMATLPAQLLRDTLDYIEELEQQL